MNALEIEQAASKLAGQTFDAAEFPYAFLMAASGSPNGVLPAPQKRRWLINYTAA